ncbi:MAG: LytTR family transcriptional regulator DNA-binding domain-containing protein [Chitinophagaceae bacterium]|nr:LytTR family transcriptional regulator DNA-binding domain-containing protein [Chitinophagaceae bacterium]
MIKAILIDDEPLSRSLIKEYLERYPEIRIVQECQDGFEGVKAIMQYQPRLIFLDIQMPKINGFEMLELIERPPAVIFITAFDEYAIRAFEQHAVDYLLKPFSQERFAKAIEKFMEHAGDPLPATATQPLLSAAALSPQQRERIVVKTGGKIKIIRVEDIYYLEAADDYVKIYTKEGGFLKNRTMAYFEDLLERDQYVRTHRSFMVNIQQITRIEPYEKEGRLAVLKTGEKIPVSKSGYARLREVLDV